MLFIAEIEIGRKEEIEEEFKKWSMKMVNGYRLRGLFKKKGGQRK